MAVSSPESPQNSMEGRVSVTVTVSVRVSAMAMACITNKQTSVLNLV